MQQHHDVPFLAKEDVTIISVSDVIEATAIRTLLEGFNYRVTVHWVGSRKELLMLLDGSIGTDGTIVLSCHGVDAGIYVPGEAPLGAEEVQEVSRLEGKTVISLGCLTGSPAFATAFKTAGVAHYAAPTDSPEGRAALNFASNLFFLLAAGRSVEDAVSRAAMFDPETAQFELLF
jgi:hypothetical protein